MMFNKEKFSRKLKSINIGRINPHTKSGMAEQSSALNTRNTRISVRVKAKPILVCGFTIIELMVVIAIIALLSTIGIVQFSTAQQKSRDVRRLSDAQEIKKALNLYQIDNTSFPIHPSSIIITGDDAFSLALEASGAITDVPIDPLVGFIYTYQSNSAGTDYDISFCLETNTIANYSQGCGNTIGP